MNPTTWRVGAGLLIVPVIVDVLLVTAPAVVDNGLGTVLVWGAVAAALAGAGLLLAGRRHTHTGLHTALAVLAAIAAVLRLAALTWALSSDPNIGAGIIGLAAGVVLAVTGLIALARPPRN